MSEQPGQGRVGAGRARRTDEWGVPVRSTSSPDAFDDAGREVAAVLRSAHAAAEEILREARAEADSQRRRGEQDARRIREAAAKDARDDLRRAAIDSAVEAQEQLGSLRAELREALGTLRGGPIDEIQHALTEIEAEQAHLQAVLADVGRASIGDDATHRAGRGGAPRTDQPSQR